LDGELGREEQPGLRSHSVCMEEGGGEEKMI
jgi:hypothetical protein